jgi:hypothetical protein
MEPAPALLPAQVDRGRDRVLESCADPLVPLEVGVDRELDLSAELDLFEP